MAIIIWSVILMVLAISILIIGIWYNKRKKENNMSKNNITAKEIEKVVDSKDYEYFKPTNNNELKNNNNSKESSNISAFTVLGWFIFMLDIIGFILMMVFKVNTATIILNLFSSIVILACIFGLGNAREETSLLEKNNKELEDDVSCLKAKIKELEKNIKKINKKD